MKKIFWLAAIIFFAVSGTAFAAKDYQSVGVVIIGGADFKTDDFYKIVRNELKPKSGAKIFVGNEMQTLYKKYWLREGYIGEQTPQKKDLINFAAMSGHKKIVCIIVADSVVDRHNTPKSREKDRVSVQLDAYLCTPANVEDVFSASDEELSKTSNLRARRGAFQKCLKEIAKTLNKNI